jgi:hypothetical protein
VAFCAEPLDGVTVNLALARLELVGVHDITVAVPDAFVEFVNWGLFAASCILTLFGLSEKSQVSLATAGSISIFLGSGVKTPSSGLKRLQLGCPGKYRFCEIFYLRRGPESEHRPILWAGQFGGNKK